MKFSNPFKKIFKRSGKLGHRSLITPNTLERDWKILLIFFFVINGIVVGSSYYLFYRVSARDIFKVEEREIGHAATIDELLLEDALEIVSIKQKEAGLLGTTPRNIEDPSE